jgi:hypothetical protein
MDETIVLDVGRMQERAATLRGINVDYQGLDDRLRRVHGELPPMPGPTADQVREYLEALRRALSGVMNELEGVAADLVHRAALAEQSQQALLAGIVEQAMKPLDVPRPQIMINIRPARGRLHEAAVRGARPVAGAVDCRMG